MADDSSVPEYFEGLRVMVIDDQEYMRTLMFSILRALGIRHIAAFPDAVEAYKAFKANETGLILTDWNMKPVDGIQFVRRVRTGDDSPNPFVPIVMVTGHNHAGKVMHARNAGANDFLIKPVSAKSMYLRIRNTLENPQPFARSTKYFGPNRRRRDLGPRTGMGERQIEKSTKVVAA
jgi:DNA-binding response OmpR family regulator